uniref:PDZ domain-containing protein n=1 Tax=Toxocara canis TaxID=6265 RepID=A0A183U0X7_TOXCA
LSGITGSGDGTLYVDDSLVGLSTAIAREIYYNARTQQAAGQLQQPLGQLGPVAQSQTFDQRAIPTSDTARTAAERSTFKPPIITVTKQEPLRTEQFGETTIVETRRSPQVLPQSSHHLSPKVPTAQPMESLHDDLEPVNSALSKAPRSQSTLLSSRKTGKGSEGTAITRNSQNPTSKVLPYPRFMPSPSVYNSQQTSSEELQQGSALLQNEFSQTSLRPVAAVPVLNSDLIVTTNNASNMSPLFVTGRFTPSGTNRAFQYTPTFLGVGGASLPTQWSQQLAARMAGVDVSSNRRHSDVQSTFVGDSGLMFTQPPPLHASVLANSGLDTGLLPSAPQSAMKFGSFGKGRAPDASYEEIFNVRRHRH